MEKNEKRKEQIEQIKEKQIKEKKESLEDKSIPFSLFEPNPRPQNIRELWVIHDSDKPNIVIKTREKNKTIF